MSTPNYVQRLRFQFRKFGPTRFISHLDIARTWERALNRSKIPVAYTQGFNQRPRLQFATATPLGTTSDCEFIDIWLKEALDPQVAKEKLLERMAPGLDIVTASEVPVSEKALQTQTRRTSYEVILLDPVDLAELQKNIGIILDSAEVIRERTVKKKVKQYDLRPLIYEMEAEPLDGDRATIYMTLALEPSKTGRPDEVLKQLGIDPLDCKIHRTTVTFAEKA